MARSITARLIVLNVCWLAGITWATVMGYTSFVFLGDKSFASIVIALILIASVIASFLGRYGSLAEATVVCSALGLFGTFIGFISSLYGFDFSALHTPEGLLAVGDRIVSGMPTALCSSVSGLVAGLWIGTIGKVVGVRAWPC